MTTASEPLHESQAPAETARGSSVVVVSDMSELAAYLPEWEALAAEALEPNPFHEPWMLGPALSAFAAGRGGGTGSRQVRIILVFVRDPERAATAPRVLAGVFPLESARWYRGLPVRVVRLWKHAHCFLSTPLVHAGYARQCLAAFLDWLPEGGKANLLEMQAIAADGPFHRLLMEELTQRRMFSHVTDLHSRPLLRPRGDAELYLARVLGGKRRGNLRRREQRLSEQGDPVEYDLLQATDDVSAWIEEFLKLEASGWKGRQGTALACREADCRFFRSIAEAAFARGRLLMLALRLGGRAIAMKTGFTAGEGAFLFKPAFDQDLARFSPGILIDQFAIRHFHQLRKERELAWVDSCSAPDNAVLGELWLDRRPIQNLLISTRKAGSDLLVSSMPLLRWCRQKLRSDAAGRPGATEAAGRPAEEPAQC